jgi:hypothetical protein
MKALLLRVCSGGAALVVAALIWLPCLHFFYRSAAVNFRTAGVSPEAKALTARHLHLWADADARTEELVRLRRSDAEWDFMGRSFFVWSLANIGLRDPASAPECLKVMDQIIGQTLKLEREQGLYFFLMPYAKARPFNLEPPRSLFLDSEIALMLASRRLLQESPEYGPLLRDRVDLMVSRMEQSPLLSAESYPDEYWVFDNVAALAAMRLADRLDGTDHSALCRRWVAVAREKLIDKETGLLVPRFARDGTPLDSPRSSSLWFIAHCLQLIDPGFAREQYDKAKKEFARELCGFGYATEYPRSVPDQSDIDSGAVIPGLRVSAGGSGLALLGAASFGDEDYLRALARTLHFAAFPSYRKGALKYCASNQAGDAAILYAAVVGPVWEKAREAPK